MAHQPDKELTQEVPRKVSLSESTMQCHRYCGHDISWKLKGMTLKIQLYSRIIRAQYCWKRMARHRAEKELAILTSDTFLCY